ncbi:MAG: NAD(P)H-hydrate epimerase [Elusimicrobiales bacterium]|nr:NAD(P)H-hydrate epimerase [Elusimicrobiales bacterium]
MKNSNIKNSGYLSVTADIMKKIDQEATRYYSITEETLMENAGKACAIEIEKYISENIKKNYGDIMITVFSGKGNNGGDGLVCGRYLSYKGFNVIVYMVPPSEKGYNSLVIKNIDMAKRKGIPVRTIDPNSIYNILDDIKRTDLIVDALLGISTVGKPSGIVENIINIINASVKKVVSIDIPSGINPDTGEVSGVCVNSVLTLTLGLLKSGLLNEDAKKYAGTVKVVDIGYPQELIKKYLKV